MSDERSTSSTRRALVHERRQLAGTAIAVGLAAVLGHRAIAAPNQVPLRPASSFANIPKPAERSRALFEEAGKVIQHARCLNCHPTGDQPTRGDGGAPHLPAVVRGPDGHGAVGLRCQSCHRSENDASSRVPGHPLWALAPIEMAWQGRTLGQICERLKDPNRNGGKTLEQLHEYMAHDTLVGWGWFPGADRTPVPGTQEVFGGLIRAWIDTGAECPEP